MPICGSATGFLQRSMSVGVCMLASILACFLAGSTPAVHAEDKRVLSGVSAAEITTPKKTLAGLYLHAEEARRFLEAYPDIVLIDVRPSQFVQMRSLAIAHAHLPILLPVDHGRAGTSGGASGPAVDADGVPLPSMLVNPGFVEHVRELLKERGMNPSTGTVFVFCGRGMFSARAADLLTESGFNNVYAIIDSFES